ncbi:hypothetical protein IMG5_153330 [Ichthyophthirius multifiliis]|uniref:Transmembrane protein n=1 Tax=Ichthyophthirius multifiliis TaxID=5932 RepID=G0QYZ0_ICHMU|nr:hypothetical protein IMG5_153330 [Ichthyophthirius multifiliis]EGR29561.1 hypothetical protein IMG5_153330 [Ichthyophthirius multifiliis]|eukprot:XP_004030797.1 hypothetical protein IMG5_153330 [Ichthyophthirius multifiliis]
MTQNAVEQEDIHHQGVIGAPVINGVHTIHLPKNSSLAAKIWATRDMFYEHHWEVKNTLVAGLKGGLFGLGVAAYISISYKSIPSIVLKKMLRYINLNTFGHAHLLKELYLPYGLTGFGIGSLYYTYNAILRPGPSLPYEIFSNAFFGQFLFAVCFNPAAHHIGFIGGLFFGMGKFYFMNSNNSAWRSTNGFYSHIGDLSDEQRRRQQYQDYFAGMVGYNDIRGQSLIDL